MKSHAYFDESNQQEQIRTHLGTRSYMASHPEVRPYFRGENRPEHFGDRIWPATLVMMKYCSDVKAKSVLELGCGWGVLGVHLARVLGISVDCSDLDPLLEPIVQAQASLNQVKVGFKAKGFKELSEKDINKELIVGADICYSEETVQDLISLVKKASKGKTQSIIIGDSGRPDFSDLCKFAEVHFKTKLIEDEETCPGLKNWILTIDLTS